MSDFILLIVFVALFVFWVMQLLSLMMMPDDAFPGRYDKIIWAAVLVVLTVFGALLFVIWKKFYQVDRDAHAIVGQVGHMIRQSGVADDES